MRVAFGSAVLAALLGGAGCHNPCQQICSRMADYATEDCGFTVTPAEIDSCVEREGQNVESEDRKACRDLGSPESIRAQWSCEDLAPYWSADEA